MPISKGFAKAVKAGKAIGCTAIQIFTANPRSWTGKEITDEAAEEFLRVREETGIQSFVSHDTYLDNLCATDPVVRSNSIRNLKEELLRCHKLQIPYTVSHMGAHLGQGEDIGLKRVAEATLEILADTPGDTHICMETTAGQGSALDYKFEHLAAILEACKWDKRLVICLDTCHIFVAGYDISTKEGYEQTFEQFDKIIGLDRLKVIHCNDTKKALGSKVDRHEHIGEGFIGPLAFELLVNDPRFENVPIILETPMPETMHQQNLERLKSYIH